MKLDDDTVASEYAQERRSFWDTRATAQKPASAMQRFYRAYLAKMYSFYIPAGLRVLALGCGRGDLLNAVRPSYGVGVDFAPAMLETARAAHPHLHFVQADAHALTPLTQAGHGDTPFDIIILSDLVNDAWDVHLIFEELRPLCGPHTRIILNFHSHLWEHPFGLVQKLGYVTPRLTQNWFTPEDVENLANLNGYEMVRRDRALLWPWRTPVIEPLFNRYLARLWPISKLTLTHFMVLRPAAHAKEYSVSVIIPARNEAGNIEDALQRTPDMGSHTEIIFVEGHSTDTTWATIQAMAEKYKHRSIQIMQQPGKGKGDAVRVGFAAAKNDVLMILDADLTMPPEILPQFYEAIASGKAEFANGVRLVYPQEKQAMRFCNLVANKFFSLAFSWLLGASIKDTLCGTKVLTRDNYQRLATNRAYFGDFDPFGDFDLIFGAAKLNLKMRDIPVRYRDRVYGETNISRWRDGWTLLRMVFFAARRIKFI